MLPFKPTAAQKRVLAEIAADLEKPTPMNRLLQGDVGSGKTIIALQAAVIAIENGAQAALMAPTEILAVQHFLSAGRILAKARYRVEMLISGLKSAEKSAALDRIRSGEAQLVIGTHALIEDNVAFARLGFVAIDEQHRFGVLQRKRLMDKAAALGHAPHVLVLTATPIPRTLSLTLYGDLDVSVLDELPPGRTPIVTRMTTQQHLPRVWAGLARGPGNPLPSPSPPLQWRTKPAPRLEPMVRPSTGSEIAEPDLLPRGPGDFFGTRQAGNLGFHIANPLRDKELLELARREAFALAADSAQQDAMQRLLRQLPSEWQRRYHLARIG